MPTLLALLLCILLPSILYLEPLRYSSYKIQRWSSYHYRPSQGSHLSDVVLLSNSVSIVRIRIGSLYARTTRSDPPLEVFEGFLPSGSFFPTLKMPKIIPVVTKIPTATTVKPAPKNPAPTGLTLPPHLNPSPPRPTFPCRVFPCRN